MEFKWLCIAAAIMIVAMFISVGYSDGKRFDCIKEVYKINPENAKAICK